jgi:hypothetical protein
MIHESVWSSGGMILTEENQSTQKTCHSATVFHKSHVDWPGREPRTCKMTASRRYREREKRMAQQRGGGRIIIKRRDG